MMLIQKALLNANIKVITGILLAISASSITDNPAKKRQRVTIFSSLFLPNEKLLTTALPSNPPIEEINSKLP